MIIINVSGSSSNVGAVAIRSLSRFPPSSLSREPSAGNEKSVCLNDFFIASDFSLDHGMNFHDNHD